MASSTDPLAHPPLPRWRLYISTLNTPRRPPEYIPIHHPTYLHIFSSHSSRACTSTCFILPLSTHLHPCFRSSTNPTIYPFPSTHPDTISPTHPPYFLSIVSCTLVTSLHKPSYVYHLLHLSTHRLMASTHLCPTHVPTHHFTHPVIHANIHPFFLAPIYNPSYANIKNMNPPLPMYPTS